MPVGALRARELSVGHVADEDVPERVLVLALDRGAALPPDELLALESVEQPIQLIALTTERAGPEDLAHDRRVLQHPLLICGEPVDPGSDDALDGIRQRQALDGAALAVEQCVLLGIERVAAGVLQQRRLGLSREQRLAEQLAD
jgi:hypothetical protein